MRVAQRWRAAWLRPMPGLVVGLLVLASVGGFLLSRSVLQDQERRLLAQRSEEAKALLADALAGVESSLRVLGPVGLSSEAAPALFAASASHLVERGYALGVAVRGQGPVRLVAAAGAGPPSGSMLTGSRAALVDRALALDEPLLVTDLVGDGGQPLLMLAWPLEGSSAVVYAELVMDTTPRNPRLPSFPFEDLSLALYTSPVQDPSRLVLTTDEDPPVTGESGVVSVPIQVGADRWLLVVTSREALVGSFETAVPWILLAGGLATALLAGAVTVTLARRRDYALELVAERTRELQDTLARLRETQAFLDRLVESGPVLVKRIGVADRRITYVSANVERVLGVSEREALAPGFLGSQVHPEDRAGLDAAFERVANGSSTVEVNEHRIDRGDGAYRWISTVYLPETDASGDIVAILGYALDVDDRRRAEDARREAQAAAEGANRAKSHFLSRMSHELRTPLNSILGFGQLLELEDLTDAQGESVSHILKAGRHLLDLINEVLDISRIEAGEMSLSPEPVLTDDVVHESVDLVRPLADERGIHLVIRRAAALDRYMLADRQRVKQVLLNLLVNAVKYNRSNGSVVVSCDQGGGNRVRIQVTDTGVGIPAERMDQLFTPFERLGAEGTGEEGTGIGLALSRTLAEAMGGTLDVSSALGRGSTFTVDLPQVEGPTDRHERLSPSVVGQERLTPARHAVLHVEDNLANLRLVEKVLAQRAGIEVIPAMFGRLGLELAREHRPVIVLLDLHLPDMSGEDVLKRLRDDPDTASIPVVIVSADATPGQVRRLLNCGAAGYLTKPIDVRELLRLVDEAVEAT